MRAMRPVVASAVALFLMGGAWLACGGDDSSGGTPGADGGAGDATFDSSSQADTGGGTDSGGDTGVVSDGGGGDAPSDAPGDVQLVGDSGNTVTDAGPGGDAAVLTCGSAQCQLPTQTCCVYSDLNPPPPFYVSCSTGASCPLLVDAGFDASPAVALQCESETNCSGGLLCCMTSTNDGGTISAHCASACSGGEQRAVLCDPAADGGCAGDAGCSNANIGTWRLPSGFATCGGVAR